MINEKIGGSRNFMRWIIHVDMDAFYAAVEQRDNPELQGKPVIVGGTSNRGVVSTCSYEARQYGVKSAMPLFQAKKLCPQGIYLPPRPAVYQEVSREIMNIMYQATPLVEPLSIDEAFLDITGSIRLLGNPQQIGWKLKESIYHEVGLTASIGIANNKFLAKIASDINKPNGFKIIKQEEAKDFLANLPVTRLWGVGAKTKEKLHGLNIKTIGHLQQLPIPAAEKIFGSNTAKMLQLAVGIDHRPVEVDQQVKSIGNEITFSEDYQDKLVLQQLLLKLAEKVARRMRKENLAGRTITLKIKFNNFKQITRSITINKLINCEVKIFHLAKELLAQEQLTLPVRLIGITVSNLDLDSEQITQLTLFQEENKENEEKITRLSDTLDHLRDKHGEKIIGRGMLAVKGNIFRK